LVWSIKRRETLREGAADPWDGRTLEWSTTSPPPAYNFARLPQVGGLDAYWEAKQEVMPVSAEPFEAIEIPKNSGLGFFMSFFAVIGGFGMIWHIWWMGILALIAFFALIAWSSWDENDEFELSADEVARLERAHPHVA
jgi:cytochrome o ubiquinol oxidase subunit 1